MMTAAMGIANEAELPGFAVFSTPQVTQPPQHIYAQTPDYGDDWAAFAKYYMDNIWDGQGQPKMALHLLNNSTGAGAKNAAELLADDLGIDLVLIEEHTSTTADETASLTRIRAQNPDILYISSTPAPTAVIIGNAVDLGMYPGITIGCGHASFTSEMVELAGADANGVYGVFPTVGWGDNVPGMAKLVQYAETNNPEFVGNMDYITAWNEGLIIAEILRTAILNTPGGGNALTPQLVESNGIKKLDYDVEELQGAVSYTSGDNRLTNLVKLYQVVNGQIEVIGDWIEAPYIDYDF
jgi:branched-chain amino acid transport system substrate-binding protein